MRSDKRTTFYNLAHYGNILAHYSGQGNIECEDGEEYNCAFDVGQLRNGKIILLCDFPKAIFFFENHAVKSFSGITHDGRKITIEQYLQETNYLPRRPLERSEGTWAAFQIQELVILPKSKAEVANFHFGLTNCRIGIPSAIPLDVPQGSVKVKFNPVSHYRDITKKLITIKNIDVTCEIIIEANAVDPQEINSLVDDVCFVLSIAFGTKVQWIYRDNYDKIGRLLSRHHFAHIAKPLNSLILIDERSLNEIMDFVKQVLRKYISIKEQLQLHKGVVDAYLDAKADADFLQTRGAKLAILMEMFKSVYLSATNMNIHEDIINKDLFGVLSKKIKQTIRQSASSASDDILSSVLSKQKRKAMYEKIQELNRVSFNEVLLSIFQSLDYQVETVDLKLFIASRNKLVHTGRFYCESATEEESKKCKPLANVRDEYFFLVHFLDRIFLRLLDYKGIYIDWSIPGDVSRKEFN